MMTGYMLRKNRVDRVLARVLPYYNANVFCKILTSVLILIIVFFVIGVFVVPIYNRVTQKIIKG